MSKVRTLGYALNHAIQENFCPGESKRSAKFQLHGETDNKVYSYAHKDGLHSTAKDFAKFTKETFGIRTVYEIDSKHIAAYIEHKAKTCNEKTLLKLSSHLAKLELCCKCTYSSEKINWGVKDVIIPVSANNSGITKDKPMDWETSQKVIDYMTRPGTRSEAYRSLELSRLLGMRVEETVNARADRFHLEPSRAFPFGYVEIRKGDGSKGNRPRIIPIQTKEQLESLKTICAGRAGNDFIIQKSSIGNKPLGKKSVSKAFSRALKDLGLEKYKGNLNHALRKDWAQRSYDLYRENHTKSESVRYVNRILGHGEERSMTELSKYVNNIW